MNIRDQIKNVKQGISNKITITHDILPEITFDHICMIIYYSYHNMCRLDITNIAEFRRCEVFQRVYIIINTDFKNPEIIAMLFIIQSSTTTTKVGFRNIQNYDDLKTTKLTGNTLFIQTAKKYKIYDYPCTKKIIELLEINLSRDIETEDMIDAYLS